MIRALKTAWPRFAGGVILALLVNCGCSGINASKSVSPIDFLLPGLHLQNEPPRPVQPAATNALVCSTGSDYSLAPR
jgi:hypothetical protein